ANSAIPLLREEGFSAGTTVYLDIETSGPQSTPELNYIKDWCSAVSSAGYQPAIYCLTSAYTSISATEPSVPYWIANPIHDPQTTTTPFPAPDPSGSGVSNATVWQYWDSPGSPPYYDITGIPTSIVPSGIIQEVDLDSVKLSTSSPPPPSPPPPQPPSGLLLSPSADSGAQGDGITDVKTPTIIGFGVAGDTVTLNDGATAIGQTNVGPNGNWSIITTPLALGAHSLTATESDSRGNVSATSSPLPLSIVQSPAVDDFN